jgi:tannase/feruloyl esterase
VKDGLIQNPAPCHSDPNALVKPGCLVTDNTGLSQGEADTLRAYFTAARDDDGNVVYPGGAISDLAKGPAGFSDPALTAMRSVMFYQDLANDAENGIEETQDNVRLFLVPGMHHCLGGPGPNVFDTLTALENWVEHGAAPDGIIAAHFPGNAAVGAPGTQDRTMPLCMYPEEAQFTLDPIPPLPRTSTMRPIGSAGRVIDACSRSGSTAASPDSVAARPRTTATMVDLMVTAKTAVTAIAKPAAVGMSAARGLRPRAHRGGGTRPDVAGKPLLGAATRISISRPPWRHRLL